jgi:hypothetical protein
VSGQVAILLHLSGHKTNDRPGLNLIAAILVHVSGQCVRSSSHLTSLSGHTTSDSPGLISIVAILVLVSGQVAVLLNLSGHKTSDRSGPKFDSRHLGPYTERNYL